MGVNAMLYAIAVGVLLAGLAPDEGQPPTDAAVLRALPRVPRGTPQVYEEYRDNVVIVKNLLARTTVSLPQADGAALKVVKRHYECVVCFDRVIEAPFPFPIHLRKSETMVVYIDEFTPAK
jgi:hypothetical protein